MFELMLSLLDTLLYFLNLKAVSNFSVVKSEYFMVSLKDIKYSVRPVETGRISFAREEPKSVRKELISLAICSSECNEFLLILGAWGKVLFFSLLYRLFLSLTAMMSLYFLDRSIIFSCKDYFFVCLVKISLIINKILTFALIFSSLNSKNNRKLIWNITFDYRFL